MKTTKLSQKDVGGEVKELLFFYLVLYVLLSIGISQYSREHRLGNGSLKPLVRFKWGFQQNVPLLMRTSIKYKTENVTCATFN